MLQASGSGAGLILEGVVLLTRNFKLHAGWILFVLLLVVGGAIWQSVASGYAGRSVGGSSLVGLVLGTIAASIILFELLLWPRKKYRKLKLGPTRYWMAGHIWLGLASGPLAFIHAGYRFGGTFSSILMCLLIFVLASGIYGWIMQILIPRWMLANLPSETICGQIDEVAIQNVLDARRMLTVAYGPKPEGLVKLSNLDTASASLNHVRIAGQAFGDTVGQKQVVVGAVQRRGPSRGRSSLQSEFDVEQTDSRVVWKEYAAVIDAYLLEDVKVIGSNLSKGGSKSRQGRGLLLGGDEAIQLRNYQKARTWFMLLREACSPSSSVILDRLEDFCDQKRQFDVQRRMQGWLHSWIAVHASISVLLGVLLVAHIVLAIRYM